MAYTTLAAVRAEGLDVADASDARVTALIAEAEAFIDQVTGQFFDPTALTLTLDGPPGGVAWPLTTRTTQPEWSRGGVLLLPIFAIAITEVRRVYPGTTTPDTVVAATDYINYNRDWPDDRRNPHLRHIIGSWERGHQIYEVDGTFGFVDDPGGANTTPAGITRACILLVVRWHLELGDEASWIDRFEHGSLRSMSVQGRNESFGSGSSGVFGNAAGTYSGDPEIDRILARFRRPIAARPV